eukprot:SAG25_NODE_121_length_14652_cov_9.937607_8_plen_84_part_00
MSSRPDQGRGGGRARSRSWSHEEVAQVVHVGREQRGKQLGEAGFTELSCLVLRGCSPPHMKSRGCCSFYFILAPCGVYHILLG